MTLPKPLEEQMREAAEKYLMGTSYVLWMHETFIETYLAAAREWYKRGVEDAIRAIEQLNDDPIGTCYECAEHSADDIVKTIRKLLEGK